MRTGKYITPITQYSFLLLWGAGAFLKLQDVPKWQHELKKQIFPLWTVDILWWLLPAVQILLILLLLYRPMLRIGLKLSTIVISLFTIYLLAGVTKVFGRIPCACGGIWPSNEHWLHIALNTIFIIIGILYWVLAHKSRPAGDVLPDVRGKEDTVLT